MQSTYTTNGGIEIQITEAIPNTMDNGKVNIPVVVRIGSMGFSIQNWEIPNLAIYLRRVADDLEKVPIGNVSIGELMGAAATQVEEDVPSLWEQSVEEEW